ncbi:MAG: hypothetical protein V1736_05570 [Pseudomonadota bacterium]
MILRWHDIDFQIKLLGALSVGDVRTGTIPSLLPSQKHYLKVYRDFKVPKSDGPLVTSSANRIWPLPPACGGIHLPRIRL